MFVAYEYQRPRLTWAAAAAVLLVKEDAAFYLLVFAVYLFVSRREKKKGLLLGGAALAYFILAVSLLMTVGDGAMFGRYDNLATGDGGLAGIAVNFLRNPGYFVEQLLSTSLGDREKLWYLFLLLAPLAFLPFLTQRYSRLLLLAPLLLNLLTRYKYQYNAGYQYSFGIAAFLFYLTILNLSEWKGSSRRPLLLLAVCASCFLYTMNVIPRLVGHVGQYHRNQAVYQQMDALLDTIPPDASVTASSMLVPHLAERDTIYEIAYHSEPDTQYLVLDMRSASQKLSQEQAVSWQKAGYVVDQELKNLVLILKKDDA
ncbi:MAG: DUF2079 domain-containing protein [Clostridiales bacterium]|nr:DUF2079 domain-containing protein [Clostridiales bacterium]